MSLSLDVVTKIAVVSPLYLPGCNEEGMLTLLYRPNRVVCQWGLIQRVPEEVRDLDNSLKEGFDCLGSKGPTVRDIVIVPWQR